MKLNRLFSYVGSKRRQLDIINILISYVNSKVYVQPFLGSGIVLLNIEKQFEQYHLAQKNQSILTIFKQCKDKIMLCFQQYYNIQCKQFSNFDYNGYYQYRDYFNKNLYKTNCPSQAMGLIILIACSINNICRFGPNGYNQSYGQRNITKNKMNQILSSIKKLHQISDRCVFYNDFEQCIIDKQNSLIMLDPPYIKRNILGSKEWNQSQLYRLLNCLNFNYNNLLYTNKIIYFDIQNEISDQYFNKTIRLENTIKNISPNRKKQNTYEQIIYTNI